MNESDVAPPPTTCVGCSSCCEEQGLPPGYLDPERLLFLPEALREQIAWHLQEEAETGWTRHERQLPCIWLDLETRLCTQYALRPDRCRDFPVGGSGCAFWRARRPPLPAQPVRRRRRTATRAEKIDGAPPE